MSGVKKESEDEDEMMNQLLSGLVNDVTEGAGGDVVEQAAVSVPIAAEGEQPSVSVSAEELVKQDGTGVNNDSDDNSHNEQETQPEFKSPAGRPALQDSEIISTPNWVPKGKPPFTDLSGTPTNTPQMRDTVPFTPTSDDPTPTFTDNKHDEMTVTLDEFWAGRDAPMADTIASGDYDPEYDGVSDVSAPQHGLFPTPSMQSVLREPDAATPSAGQTHAKKEEEAKTGLTELAQATANSSNSSNHDNNSKAGDNSDDDDDNYSDYSDDFDDNDNEQKSYRPSIDDSDFSALSPQQQQRAEKEQTPAPATTPPPSSPTSFPNKQPYSALDDTDSSDDEFQTPSFPATDNLDASSDSDDDDIDQLLKTLG